MRKIIECTIINDVELQRFIGQINSMLSQGWSLYGYPYSTADESCIEHYQAMVKYDEEGI